MSETKDRVKQSIRFFVNSVLNEAKSQELGIDQFEDQIYVSVLLSKNQEACLRATKEHYEQFPQQWSRFRETAEYQAFAAAESEGEATFTPLKTLQGITPARLAELESVGIRSIERLSTATDDAIAHVKGWGKLRDAAKAKLAEPPKAFGRPLKQQPAQQPDVAV